MIFCIEEHHIKIVDATSHLLDRPEMLRPFVVNDKYMSFNPVILFSDKKEAIDYYNNRVIPNSITFISIQISSYKIKLNPDNYRKITGFVDIVESKISEFSGKPELWNLADIKEILDDKLKLLKSLREGCYNLTYQSDLTEKCNLKHA